MKAVSTFALVAALVVVLTSWAAPPPPQPFSMSVIGFSTGPNSAAGTWTSTGGIADSGTFATTFTYSGAPGALGAVVHADTLLTTATGTITLRHTSTQTLVSPIEVNLHGPTHVTGGTGAYAGIKGHSIMDLSLDLTNGNLTATLTGVVTR